MERISMIVHMADSEKPVYDAVEKKLREELGDDVVDHRGVFMMLLWDYYVDKFPKVFKDLQGEEEESKRELTLLESVFLEKFKGVRGNLDGYYNRAVLEQDKTALVILEKMLKDIEEVGHTVVTEESERFLAAQQIKYDNYIKRLEEKNE